MRPHAVSGRWRGWPERAARQYRASLRDTESLFGPSRRPVPAARRRSAAIPAALEEVVAIFRTDRQQSELREARIGIDDQRVGRGEKRFQIGAGRRVARPAFRGGKRQGRVQCADRRRRAGSFSAGPTKTIRACGKRRLAASRSTLVTATSAPERHTREHEDACEVRSRRRADADAAVARRRPHRGWLARTDRHRRRTAPARSGRPDLRRECRRAPGRRRRRRARAAVRRAFGRRWRAPADRARSRYTKYLSMRIPNFWRVAAGHGGFIGEDGVLERRPAFAGAPARHGGDGRGHHRAGVFGVLHQVGDDVGRR